MTSSPTRQKLVANPKLYFADGAEGLQQRNDLLDATRTSTYLIALLVFLVDKGHAIQFTAIRADHHDDSDLAAAPWHIGTHAFGWAVDCWPVANARDAWLAPGELEAFLRDAATGPYHFQIGLAGSACLPGNFGAAGTGGCFVFQDTGADHIHLSVRPPT